MDQKMQIGKVDLYIKIKIFSFVLALAFIILIRYMGLMSPGIFILIISIFLFNIFLSWLMRFLIHSTGKFYWPTILLLAADLAMMILSIYLNGGIETPLFYLPIFLIYTVNFIFNIYVSLAFAVSAFAGLALVLFLDYSGIIPHFGRLSLPAAYLKNAAIYVDYGLSALMVYVVSALFSGYFNNLMGKSKSELEKSLAESQRLRAAADNARELATNMMGDLQKAREQLAEDIEQLKLVDNMKNEFLSVVSHELRTPLTPIYAYNSMFLNEQFGKLDPDYLKAAQVINKECEHLLKLIDSILDVARLESGRAFAVNRESFNLAELITELIEVLESEAQARRIKVETRLAPDLPSIQADPVKIRRLLTNVLGNSLKFTPSGGLITIAAAQEDKTIKVQVTDSGIGIAAESLPKIFNKFFQVDSSYTRAVGGVGLGLAVAKAIVESHGGTIWAESEGLGKGTKIIFTLPLSF